MLIRRLDAQDAAAYFEVRLQALVEAPRAFGQSAAEHTALGIEGTATRLAHPDNITLGAWEDEALVATATFLRETQAKSRHKGKIVGVYVSPGSRGHGIGKRVLEELIQAITAAGGVRRVSLSVAVENRAAQNLYRSLGFQSWGQEPAALCIDGVDVDEEWMSRRL